MLDLYARVHLDEKPFATFDIDQELDRARVRVADLARDPQRRVAQAVDDLLINAVAGRLLDHFLVAALHGTITLVEVQNIAVLVAQDLHLDVLGAPDEFLQEHRAVAKGALRLALRLVQQRLQFLRLPHDTHAAPAAAKSRLDDQRKSNRLRNRQGLLAALDRLFRARQRGNLELLRHVARGGFVAHHFQHARRRPDEKNALALASARQLRVLRQKTVARMNRVAPFFLRDADDALDVEIRAQRTFLLVQLVGLVRFETMRAETIFICINRDRANPEFARCAHHADGDLRAIGDKQLGDRARTWRQSGGVFCLFRHGGNIARLGRRVRVSSLTAFTSAPSRSPRCAGRTVND